MVTKVPGTCVPGSFYFILVFAPVLASVELPSVSSVGSMSVASGMLVSILGSGMLVSNVGSIVGMVAAVVGVVVAAVVAGMVVGIVSAGFLPQAHKPQTMIRVRTIAKSCFIRNLHNLIYGYSMSCVVLFNQI